MNGQIVLNINNNSVTVMGGAYLKKPRGVAGVKLAEEIDALCTVDLPIPDFSIPDEKEAQIALAKAVGLLNRYRQIYVGCMGGFGRTGIFLSLLTRLSASQAKGINSPDWVERTLRPVEWVRERYVPNAVETGEQYNFVMNLDINLLTKVARFL